MSKRFVILLAALASIVVGAVLVAPSRTPSPRWGTEATCSSGAVSVDPGESIQSVLDRAGPGASICIRRGVYRLTTPVEPKQGQTLTFEAGATLNGSRLVTNWERNGSYWMAEGHTQSFSDGAWATATNKCDDNPAACVYEDLFMDDMPLTHVLSLSELSPGKVYLDKSTSTMYIADDPTGRRMEATVLTIGIDSSVSGVTIRGATIEKIGWFGLRTTGPSWVIEDTEIRYTHITGLRLRGDDHLVRRNHIHHNGNTGIVATDGDNQTFVGNEIANNNYLGFGNKPTSHSEGGVKLLGTTNTIVRNNYIHDNQADGWWFDSNNIGVLIEGNVFEKNTRFGLHYETSFDAVIRNNIFRNNGTDRAWLGGGVRIASSKNVQIHDNIFDDNKYSTLFANWVDRGSGVYGTHETTNLEVRDNEFIMTEGWLGSSWGKEEIGSPEANNRFADNSYVVDDLNQQWWVWLPGGFTDWEGWHRNGFDRNGTLSRS
ncbi:MAG: right-handed parallel beta-helix repeat-containing protein [bacterium]